MFDLFLDPRYDFTITIISKTICDIIPTLTYHNTKIFLGKP